MKMETSIRTRRRINNTRKDAPVAINGDDKNTMTRRNTRNHFTRSRNPKSSSPPKISRSQQESNLHLEEADSAKEVETNIGATKEAEPTISIDACATILAELDSRSYHRCLMQDASNVTQKILQPMSLPWTHKVVPVARNIPCDIDEMIDIFTIDDGLHTPYEIGNFGFGQFETGRQMKGGESIVRLANSSNSFRFATRRSSDPGIIDFSTFVLPSNSSYPPDEDFSVIESSSHFCNEEARHSDDERHHIRGETLLRCFEITQALKKRKIKQARGNVKEFKISVKINSSSSRSSIFTKKSLERQQNDNNKNELSQDLLEAVLPIEVENGRKLSKKKEKLVVEELGSYNGTVLTNLGSSKSSNNRQTQTAVGRTRLIWTSNKVLPDQPQRTVVTSLITGQKIENDGHKRPRNVCLCIKVDGKIYKREDSTRKKDYNSDSSSNAGMKLQATLECDELVRSLFDAKSNFVVKFPKNRDIIPPIIECVPDSSGSIHVVCTQPGTIKNSSVNPILKLAAAKRHIPCCMVCWRSTEGGLEVKECTGCGLLVHIQCCLDPGLETNNEWTCNVCCQQDTDQSVTTIVKDSPQKLDPSGRLKFDSILSSQRINNSTAVRNEIKCNICHLSGGVMSQNIANDEKVWVHETCRIWAGSEKKSTNCTKSQLCALCGANNTLLTTSRDKHLDQSLQKSCRSICLAKCAAAGCHIYVHPMCALISSLTSQSIFQTRQKEEINLEKSKNRDVELCTQYTLTFASVQGSAYSRGKKPDVMCTVTLPVIFCGLHHPAREPSFYGLYPGGKYMDKENTLKIPSCKKPDVSK
mmetsp:Transcript_8307/g.9522  ORF Transcript_8307/g.9522 Transcript_8307/m.9522 type:complete len:813 (-) Transcript_8307:95-2533(-)